MGPTPASPSPRPGCRSCRDDPTNPVICPFFRAEVNGVIGPPIEAPDAANRCAALAEVVPQSLRQQQLVCLTSGHVNCPRYQHGAVAMTPVPVARPRAARHADAGHRHLPRDARPLVHDLGGVRDGQRRAEHARRRRSPASRRPRRRRWPPRRRRTPAAATVAPSAAAPVVTPSPSAASASPAATPSPTPTPRRRPTPKPTPKPTAKPTPKPTLEPLRAADGVPRHVRLLDLPDPLGRQPREHRELLRRLAPAGQGHEPLDEDDRPQVRPAAADPDADPLSEPGPVGGRAACSRPAITLAPGPYGRSGRSKCSPNGPTCDPCTRRHIRPSPAAGHVIGRRTGHNVLLPVVLPRRSSVCSQRRWRASRWAPAARRPPPNPGHRHVQKRH